MSDLAPDEVPGAMANGAAAASTKKVASRWSVLRKHPLLTSVAATVASGIILALVTPVFDVFFKDALEGPERLLADIEITRVEPAVTLSDWMAAKSAQVPAYWAVAAQLAAPIEGQTPTGETNSTSVDSPPPVTAGGTGYQVPAAPPADVGDGNGAHGAPTWYEAASVPTAPELVPGVRISFTLEASGFAGRSVVLTWTLYYAETNRRVAIELSEVPIGEVRIEAVSSDRIATDLWIPTPEGDPGPFVVRLDVTDDRGVGLDSAQSPPFSGS